VTCNQMTLVEAQGGSSSTGTRVGGRGSTGAVVRGRGSTGTTVGGWEVESIRGGAERLEAKLIGAALGAGKQSRGSSSDGDGRREGDEGAPVMAAL
jgi:hypothetical protein